MNADAEAVAHFVFLEFHSDRFFNFLPKILLHLFMNSLVAVDKKLSIGRNDENQHAIALSSLIELVFFK